MTTNTDPIRKAAERIVGAPTGTDSFTDKAVQNTEAIIREELADVVVALKAANRVLQSEPDCAIYTAHAKLVTAALAQLEGKTDD